MDYFQSLMKKIYAQKTNTTVEKEEKYENPYISTTNNSFELDTTDTTTLGATSVENEYNVSNAYTPPKLDTGTNNRMSDFISSSNANRDIKLKQQEAEALKNKDTTYDASINKINSYSGKLDALGQEVVEPDANKQDYGKLEFLGDMFNVVATPVNVVSKIVDSGQKQDNVKDNIMNSDKWKNYIKTSDHSFGSSPKKMFNDFINAKGNEKEKAQYDEVSKDLFMGVDFKGALKTAGSSLTGSLVKPWASAFGQDEVLKAYRENNHYVVKNLQNARAGEYGEVGQDVIKVPDAITEFTLGNMSTLGWRKPLGAIIGGDMGKALSASDTATQEELQARKEAVGQFSTDMITSVLTEGKFDIVDGGKALAYMKNVRTGVLDDVAKSTTQSKALTALENARKTGIEDVAQLKSVENVRDLIAKNKLDANDVEKVEEVLTAEKAIEVTKATEKAMANATKEAEYVAKKAKDLLGDYQFEGIKYLGKTIVSKDTLTKLAQKTSTYYATKVAVTALNPFAGAYGSLKGSTHKAIQRLSEGEYANTVMGNASRTKDKVLESLYEAKTGGKFGLLKRVGLEDKTKAVDSVALIDEMKIREFKITSDNTKALKEFTDINKAMQKEHGINVTDVIHDVRRAIEKPVTNIGKQEVIKSGISNEYVHLLNGGAKKYFADLKEAMSKEHVLNGQTYTGKTKWKLKKQYEQNVQALDEYEKAINTSTLDYAKQINMATTGMKLPKGIKKDEMLNQIAFVLKKDPHQIAGHIMREHGVTKFGDAFAIAKQYKIASDSTYATLQKTLNTDLKNIPITSNKADMNAVMGTVGDAPKVVAKKSEVKKENVVAKEEVKPKTEAPKIIEKQKEINRMEGYKRDLKYEITTLKVDEQKLMDKYGNGSKENKKRILDVEKEINRVDILLKDLHANDVEKLDTPQNAKAVREIVNNVEHVDNTVSVDTPIMNKKEAIDDLRRTKFSKEDIDNNKKKYAEIFQRREKQKAKLELDVAKAQKTIDHINANQGKFPGGENAIKINQSRIDGANIKIKELEDQMNKQINANLNTNRLERKTAKENAGLNAIEKQSFDIVQQERKANKAIQALEEERANAGKSTAYDDAKTIESNFKTKFFDLQKTFGKHSENGIIIPANKTKLNEGINEAVDELMSRSDVQKDTLDKIVDFLADEGESLYSKADMKQMYLNKNLTDTLTGKGIRVTEKTTEESLQKSIQLNRKIRAYVSDKYNSINADGTLIGGEKKLLNEDGKVVTLKNEVSLNENGTLYVNNAKRIEIEVNNDNGFLYNKETGSKLKNEYNEMQEQINKAFKDKKKSADKIAKINKRLEVSQDAEQVMSDAMKGENVKPELTNVEIKEIKRLSGIVDNSTKEMERLTKLRDKVLRNDRTIQTIQGKQYKIDGEIVHLKTMNVDLKELERAKYDVDAILHFNKNKEILASKDNMFNFLSSMMKKDGKGANKFTDFETMIGVQKQLDNAGTKLQAFDDNVVNDFYKRFKSKVMFEFKQINEAIVKMPEKQRMVINANMNRYLAKLDKVGSDVDLRMEFFGSVDKINVRGNALIDTLNELKGMRNVNPVEQLASKSKMVADKNFINVHMEYQTISIDTRLSPQQASKAFRELNTQFYGVADNVTFTKNIGADGLKKGGRIYVDVTKKTTGATVSHEMGHLMNTKENAENVRNVLMNLSTKVKGMTEEEITAFKKLINKHLAHGASNDINTNLTSYIESLRLDGASDFVISREIFSEASSMMLHQNLSVRKSFQDVLGNELKEQMYELLLRNNFNKNKKYFIPQYKFANEDYVRRIENLSETLKRLDENGLLTYDEVKIKRMEVQNLLDKGEYKEIEDFLTLKTDFKLPEGIERTALFKAQSELDNIINNVNNLDVMSKKMYDVITKAFKEAGIREGVITPLTASLKEHFNYLLHMMNGELKNDVKSIVAYDNMFGKVSFKNEVDNMYAKARKHEGTIDEINAMIADNEELAVKGISRLLEDNMEKIFYKRMVEHNKTFFDKEIRQMHLDVFGEKKFNLKDLYDMAKETGFDKYGNKMFDYSEIDDMFEKLGITETRLYHDEVIDFKINKTQEIRKQEWLKDNPNVKLKPNEKPWEIPIDILHNKDKHNNIMNAYNKAYTQRIHEELATGRMEIVQMNKREVVENVKALSQGGFENVTKLNTDRMATIINEYDGKGIDGKLIEDTMDKIYNKEMSNEFALVKWQDLTDEEVIRVLDDGAYLMPKRVMQNFEEMSKKQYKGVQKAIGDIINYVNSVFKSGALLTTKFHLTNHVGNVIRSYIEMGAQAFNPMRTVQALQIKNGFKSDFKIRNGMTYKEVADSFEELGGSQTNAMREYTDRLKLIGEKGYEEGVTKNAKNKGRFNIFNTEKFVVYKASTAVGGQIEDSARMSNFVFHLEKGKTPQEAMDLTNNILFDYSDLTSFEQGTIKKILPFYTFMSKNTASQIEHLANNPKEAHLIKMMFDSAHERQSEDELALAPSYLTNGSIPLGNKQYLQIGLPFLSSLEMINPKTAVSAVSPLWKSPVEAIVNRKFYNDSNVSQFNKLDEKLSYVAQSIIPLLGQGQNLLDANRPTKNTDGTDDFTKQLAKQRVEKQWLGNVIGTYDEKMARKSALDAYAEKVNQQYYELITEQPEYLDKEKALKEAKAQKALQDYITYRTKYVSTKGNYKNEYNVNYKSK